LDKKTEKDGEKKPAHFGAGFDDFILLTFAFIT